MNSEPQCLWTTGVITKDYTALPETEYMKTEDIRWGLWSPDNAIFKENGPLIGKDQGSDRAE
eukprot:9553045-Heterocapsa_arctica.AAC.1